MESVRETSMRQKKRQGEGNKKVKGYNTRKKEEERRKKGYRVNGQTKFVVKEREKISCPS